LAGFQVLRVAAERLRLHWAPTVRGRSGGGHRPVGARDSLVLAEEEAAADPRRIATAAQREVRALLRHLDEEIE
jgi:hypothetical protein